MIGGDRQLPSTTSTKRAPGTCGVLVLLMICVHLATHVAGSTLCDRCETAEVRALRRYYISLNISSVYCIGCG